MARSFSDIGWKWEYLTRLVEVNISIYVTRLIYVWKWDGSFSVSASLCCIFISVTALIHMCTIIHSWVWHPASTRLIRTNRMHESVRIRISRSFVWIHPFRSRGNKSELKEFNRNLTLFSRNESDEFIHKKLRRQIPNKWIRENTNESDEFIRMNSMNCYEFIWRGGIESPHRPSLKL